MRDHSALHFRREKGVVTSPSTRPQKGGHCRSEKVVVSRPPYIEHTRNISGEGQGHLGQEEQGASVEQGSTWAPSAFRVPLLPEEKSPCCWSRLWTPVGPVPRLRTDGSVQIGRDDRHEGPRPSDTCPRHPWEPRFVARSPSQSSD